MAKPEQVLIIEPQNELRFKGPFCLPVTSYMKLTNPSEKKVLFKIKTTAPKRYCVRPNSGVLEANSTIEISICLQPFVFDPAEKNKHKFMVQTVFAPDSDANLDQLWRDISPDQMMDSKLKCLFEVPVEQNDTQNEEPAKVSPKALVKEAPPTVPMIESELEKASAEVQQLREEESSLRQENLRLREEILRLKHSASGQPQASKYTPTVAQPQGLSMSYIAFGIAIAIFGVILGKFIL